MRTFGITALLGLLVTLPLIFGRRNPAVVPIRQGEKGVRENETNLRYDVDDFLTE